MGTAEKLRVLIAANQEASAKANEAINRTIVIGVHFEALVKGLGYEWVKEQVGEKVLIRYCRRLPRWLTWVRKIGICR